MLLLSALNILYLFFVSFRYIFYRRLMPQKYNCIGSGNSCRAPEYPFIAIIILLKICPALPALDATMILAVFANPGMSFA